VLFFDDRSIESGMMHHRRSSTSCVKESLPSDASGSHYTIRRKEKRKKKKEKRFLESLSVKLVLHNCYLLELTNKLVQASDLNRSAIKYQCLN
jgi:hypothetical protein